MSDKRHDLRTTSGQDCDLELSGYSHQCLLDKISSSDAEVKCSGFLQESWPGDKGVLHLHDHEGDVACHITRISSSKISLRFDN